MSKYLEALSLKHAGFWSDKRLIELVRRLKPATCCNNVGEQKLLLTTMPLKHYNHPHRAQGKDFHPLVQRLWERR